MAHQEYFTLIAGGTMVGKQVKSLSVRLEEYEPHFSAAQGTRDFGGHEMRACRRRRHNLHCPSPQQGNPRRDTDQRENVLYDNRFHAKARN